MDTVRTRQEREPQPTEPEALAGDFPRWHIRRDLLDGNGDWSAACAYRTVIAPTVSGLRAAIEAVEAEQ
ncbi:hypothetical protein GCM10027440_05040 [Nocardiopsis coralliicola]